MPIREEDLVAPKNAYLVVSGQATLRQALALLRSPEVNGQPWWHLVVARTDGTWAIGTFADLYTAAKADAAKLVARLDELDSLIPARAVEQDSMESREAVAEAIRAPGNVLVVMNQGELAGILFEGLRGGDEPISTSALTELAGEPADLEEFRDLLVRKRRPKPKAPPQTGE